MAFNENDGDVDMKIYKKSAVPEEFMAILLAIFTVHHTHKTV